MAALFCLSCGGRKRLVKFMVWRVGGILAEAARHLPGGYTTGFLAFASRPIVNAITKPSIECATAERSADQLETLRRGDHEWQSMMWRSLGVVRADM